MATWATCEEGLWDFVQAPRNRSVIVWLGLLWAQGEGAAVSGILGRLPYTIGKNVPDQFFQQGSQTKFNLASNLHRLAQHPTPLEEAPWGCLEKKSSSNRGRALESWGDSLSCCGFHKLATWGHPPSLSTVGLAVSALTRWGIDY